MILSVLKYSVKPSIWDEMPRNKSGWTCTVLFSARILFEKHHFQPIRGQHLTYWPMRSSSQDVSDAPLLTDPNMQTDWAVTKPQHLPRARDVFWKYWMILASRWKPQSLIWLLSSPASDSWISWISWSPESLIWILSSPAPGSQYNVLLKWFADPDWDMN